jgi:hypothetical protein
MNPKIASRLSKVIVIVASFLIVLHSFAPPRCHRVGSETKKASRASILSFGFYIEPVPYPMENGVFRQARNEFGEWVQTNRDWDPVEMDWAAYTMQLMIILGIATGLIALVNLRRSEQDGSGNGG